MVQLLRALLSSVIAVPRRCWTISHEKEKRWSDPDKDLQHKVWRRRSGSLRLAAATRGHTASPVPGRQEDDPLRRDGGGWLDRGLGRHRRVHHRQRLRPAEKRKLGVPRLHAVHRGGGAPALYLVE